MITWNSGDHLNLIVGFYNGTIEQYALPQYPPVGCPTTITHPNGDVLTRVTRSNISYGVYPTPVRPNVNLTEWENIWGHANVNDSVTPWPGVHGAGPVIRSMARRGFVAAHFNTSNYDVPTYGSLTYPSNVGGPNIDIKISPICGDFSENTANPGCLKLGAASDDNPAIRWKFGTGNVVYYCNLQPHTDYYVNIRFSDPYSAVECPVNSVNCPLYTGNTWGP
jgi:hypothetical protein